MSLLQGLHLRHASCTTETAFLSSCGPTNYFPLWCTCPPCLVPLSRAQNPPLKDNSPGKGMLVNWGLTVEHTSCHYIISITEHLCHNFWTCKVEFAKVFFGAGIHTKETRIERDMCTPMLITALFTIVRTWKQPRCPSADEWIRKLWYIYTMYYYSVIRKNVSESVLVKWMKLESLYRMK